MPSAVGVEEVAGAGCVGDDPYVWGDEKEREKETERQRDRETERETEREMNE